MTTFDVLDEVLRRDRAFQQLESAEVSASARAYALSSYSGPSGSDR
jgi:hypothetical protein